MNLMPGSMLVTWMLLSGISNDAHPQDMTAGQPEAAMRAADDLVFAGFTATGVLCEDWSPMSKDLGKVSWQTKTSTNGTSWCAESADPAYEMNRLPEAHHFPFTSSQALPERIENRGAAGCPRTHARMRRLQTSTRGQTARLMERSSRFKW